MRHGQDQGQAQALPACDLHKDGRHVLHMTSAKPPTDGLFTDSLQGNDSEKWDTAVNMLEWVSRHMVRRGHETDSNLENDKIPAGYTYLGQLITHDMTFATQRLPTTGPTDHEPTNLNTPTLDLDCIYRGGPRASPWLYSIESYPNDDQPRKRLRVGSTRDGDKDSPSDQMEDIPRICINERYSNLRTAKTQHDINDKNPLFESLIGDDRNQDNLILSQTVLLFHKLHNKIVDHIEKSNAHLDNLEQFNLAKKVTTKVYHEIIRSDFLTKILSTEVRREFEKKESISEFKFAKNFASTHNITTNIPIEFSMAAMRVGHSMVRQLYRYSDSINERSTIGRLMDFREGAPLSKIPIEARWIIDWSLFYELCDGRRPDFSRKIVAAVAFDLSSNTRFPSQDGADVAPEKGGLIFRDFVRGLGNRLPTAQAFAKSRNQDMITTVHRKDIAKFLKEKFGDRNVDNILGVNREIRNEYIKHISANTPLLLYILMESELEPNRGRNLGILGSSIFAEVMYSTLINSNVEENKKVNTVVNRVFRTVGIPDTMPKLINFVTGKLRSVEALVA